MDEEAHADDQKRQAEVDQLQIPAFGNIGQIGVFEI
jgi:hypothetical protein